MENETKDDIITSDKIKKDWKRKRRYPPRYIARIWSLEKISFAYAKRACFVFIQDEQSDKITYIAKALVNMKGLRALMMDFHYNRKINDDALILLSKKIVTQKNLRVFQLNVNWEIRDKGIITICKSLCKIPRLRTFDLIAKECDGITNLGLKDLSKVISSFSLTSLKLDFKNCCMITEDSILVITKDIARLANLANLDLSFSEYRNSFKISDKVLILLAESISKLRSIQRLQLDFNYQQKITDQGFIPLSKSLSLLQKLVQVTLEFNNSKITDESIASLSDSLTQLPCLRRIQLNFSDCLYILRSLNITENSATLITQKFEKIKDSLKVFNLDLKNCPKIGETGNAALFSFLNEINKTPLNY